MKSIVLLVLMILTTGCTGIPSFELNKHAEFCEGKGGVHSIEVQHLFNRIKVTCNNGDFGKWFGGDFED